MALDDATDRQAALDALENGSLFRFAAWSAGAVPEAAGVYTVWEGDRLIYTGMAGRTLTAEAVSRRSGARGRGIGLRGRLDSHASGRRSGDQFCVYVCDRFVVPTLTPEQLQQIGDGTLSLDRLTRDLIHSRFAYRFVVTPDGRAALALEREIQGGALRAGKPLLNPRTSPPQDRPEPLL